MVITEPIQIPYNQVIKYEQLLIIVMTTKKN